GQPDPELGPRPRFGRRQALGGVQRRVVGLVPRPGRRRRRPARRARGGAAARAGGARDCGRARGRARRALPAHGRAAGALRRPGLRQAPRRPQPGGARGRPRGGRAPGGARPGRRPLRLPEPGHDVAGRVGGPAPVRAGPAPRAPGGGPARGGRRAPLPRQRAGQAARLRAHPVALRRPPLPHRVPGRRDELDPAAGHPRGHGPAGLRRRPRRVDPRRARRLRHERPLLRPRGRRGVPRGGRARRRRAVRPRRGVVPSRVVLPLRSRERDHAAAHGDGHDVLRRRRAGRRRADDGLRRLGTVPAGRGARRGHRHADEPGRVAAV
ncbi:MAG: hypothetical protein AVDCRST_MAG13-958, partial [uncultured Solirubrobacteraceae bacterium]